MIQTQPSGDGLEALAGSVVRDAAQDVRKEGRQRFGEAVESVRQNVRDRLRTLRVDIAGGNAELERLVEERADKYVRERQDALPGDDERRAFVDEIARREGAAGMVEPNNGGRETVDAELLDADLTPERLSYFERVGLHEHEHTCQCEPQRFDLQSLAFNGRDVPLQTLLEGDASRWNKPTDLTPQYQQWRREVLEIGYALGSGEDLRTALRTGKLQPIQDRLDARAPQRAAA